MVCREAARDKAGASRITRLAGMKSGIAPTLNAYTNIAQDLLRANNILHFCKP